MGLQNHNFLYSCTYDKKRDNEQLVTEHALGIIISGESCLFTNNGTIVSKKGTIGLIRKNQLARSIKHPAADGSPFKAINIYLSQESLKKYASKKNIAKQAQYTGDYFIDLTGNKFLQGYFGSLMPYFDAPEMLTSTLSNVKTTEAIELLLKIKPGLTNFLFDFSEPYKIDIESFMNQNYRFNVSLDKFAKLTGRSLATFKRDFEKTFNDTPGRWLIQKRLEEALFLIQQKNKKPSEIYLDLGFEDLSHFSFAFKKQFGQTPTTLSKKTPH